MRSIHPLTWIIAAIGAFILAASFDADFGAMIGTEGRVAGAVAIGVAIAWHFLSTRRPRDPRP